MKLEVFGPSPRALFSIIFFIYLLFSWKSSVPLTGDQKTYYGMALEMFTNGNWIIPHFLTVPNFVKPPFQYWVTASSYFVFGISVFAAVLPQVLAMLGASFLILKIEEELKVRSGGLSALAFAGMIGTMTYGTTVQMEVWIVLFYLWAWWLALRENLICSLIVVGAMAWIKGPLYSALWVLSFSFFGGKKLLRNPRWYVAVFIGMGVGLLWYFLAARTHLNEILDVFFFRENVGKISTGQGTALTLWSEFIISMLPVALILPLSAHVFLKAKFNWVSRNIRFACSYLILPALFFTFFPYKVNTYLYILSPLFAMWVGQWVYSNRNSQKNKTWGVTLLFVFLLALVGAGTLWILFRGDWISFSLFAAGFAILFSLLVSFSKMKWVLFLWCSLFFVNMVRWTGLEIGNREVTGLSEIIQDKGKIGYFVVGDDIWHEYGFVSAALGQPIVPIVGLTSRLENKQELMGQLLKDWDWVIFSDQVGPINEMVTALCYPWHRLKRRADFPMKQFWSGNLKVSDPQALRTFQVCKKAIK